MTLLELRYKGLLGYFAEKGSIPVFLWMIGFVVLAAAAYFLGSLNFGIIISKIKFHDDVRSHGSGNAGMTNMLRTYGKMAAAVTILGDGMKALVSILFAVLLNGRPGAYVAGLFCIIGHVFPAYYGFKGGKGVLVIAVTVLILDPLVFLVLFTMFLIVVGFTKYVSLGSILCMLMYPMVLYNFTTVDQEKYKVLIALVEAVFIIFLHRGNIKRLQEGKENKISLSFGKKKKEEKKKPDAGEETSVSEKED